MKKCFLLFIATVLFLASTLLFAEKVSNNTPAAIAKNVNGATITWSLVNKLPSDGVMQQYVVNITLQNNTSTDIQDWKLKVWQTDEISCVNDNVYRIDDGCYLFAPSLGAWNSIIPAGGSISVCYTATSSSGIINAPGSMTFSCKNSLESLLSEGSW